MSLRFCFLSNKDFSLGLCFLSICVVTFFFYFSLLVCGCICFACFHVCCCLQFFSFQLSLLVCSCNYPTDQRVEQPFPPMCLAQAMGIVYPLYWLWPNFDNSFTKHREVLKVRTMSQNVWGLEAQVHWLHCCLIVGGWMCIKGCSSCV